MLNSIKPFEENGYERTDLKNPVYMDKTKGKPKQVEKANNIISSAYNEFINKTNQTKINSVTDWSITKRTSTRVGEYHDNCFETFCHLSFYFNSSGFTANSNQAVFTIKAGTPLTGITFLGVNSYTSPSDFLNNYGYFTFTFNASVQEYHISFVSYSADLPNTSWGVYMTFAYSAKEK